MIVQKQMQCNYIVGVTDILSSRNIVKFFKVEKFLVVVYTKFPNNLLPTRKTSIL